MPPAIVPTIEESLTEDQLALINGHLSLLTPSEILQWGVEHLPGLYQTTAFGLTGLAGLDMLSKFTNSTPPLIFFDTLYHFPETLQLVEDVKTRYGIDVAVYKPDGCETAQEFEAKYGEKPWETSEEVYDYLVKVIFRFISLSVAMRLTFFCAIYQVEPAQRAYKELGVRSIITGRRASQGAARSTLQPLEVDSTGLYKLNPFVSWSFDQVKAYIDEHNVPRNALLDQGYRSIGDWHSTEKSGDGDAGERAGRWKGKGKTECGLHKDYFKMKLAAKKKVRLVCGVEDPKADNWLQLREDELQQRDEARSKGHPVETPISDVVVAIQV
jgi:phosphoadenosine phosphosulfate reductase